MEAGNVRQSLEKRSKGAVKTCKRGREKLVKEAVNVIFSSKMFVQNENENSKIGTIVVNRRRRRQIPPRKLKFAQNDKNSY